MRKEALYIIALLFSSLQTFAQTTYTYDALNRLTEVRYENGATVTYTYDALGNRLSKRVTGGPGKREAYAWLSNNGNTLTFCYDDKRSERDGTTYDLNTGNNYPDWNPDPSNNPCSVFSVTFSPSFSSVRPTTTYSWFDRFGQLESITGLEYLNTSEVEDMSNMFAGCSNLKSIDLSHFTTSKVKKMYATFWRCGVTNLDVSTFDTSNVTDMGFMFCLCGNLEDIDLSNFNTSKVTNMENMLSSCGFKNLYLRNFDTRNVQSMSYMFSNCYYLESIDVSSFNTSNVWKFYAMFYNCMSLKSLDVSNFDITSATNWDFYVDELFSKCNSLEYLSISSSMSQLASSACNNVGTADNPCTIIAPEGFDFGVDTSGSYFEWKSGYFKLGNQKEAYAWLSNDGKTLTFCYDGKREERIGTTFNLNTEEWVAPGWDEGADVESNVSKVVFEPSFADVRPIYTHYWFDGMSKLTEIEGLNYLNTSNVKRMAYMFNGCSSLSSLDLSNFDTSNVTDMEGMFKNCGSLKNLDLSSFDTSHVGLMSFMFCNCYNLEDIELSSFDLSNVTETHFMFLNCRGLTSLDLSHFDTSNVTSSSVMLSNCTSLTNLSISSSMVNLDDNACSGIGMNYGPCSITAPPGFDFGVDTSGSSFVWKSGIFKLANELTGDVNDDGNTTIADVTALVNIILGEDDTIPYLYDHDAADVNHDGSITIADVSELVNIILGK